LIVALVDTGPFYLGVHYLSRYLEIDPLADFETEALSTGQEK
jgi:hypothetical protein